MGCLPSTQSPLSSSFSIRVVSPAECPRLRAQPREGKGEFAPSESAPALGDGGGARESREGG